jgi:hypothetical protein
MKVIEAVIVAAVSATLGFMMIYFLNDCKPLGQDPTSNPIQVRRIFVVLMCVSRKMCSIGVCVFFESILYLKVRCCVVRIISRELQGRHVCWI